MSGSDQHAPKQADSGESGPETTVSVWWQCLPCVVLPVGFVALSEVLNWLLATSEMIWFFMAGIIPAVVALTEARPKTVTHVAVTAAIAAMVGTVTMLGYAAAWLVSPSKMLHVTVVGLIAGTIWMLVRPALRRFGVPLRPRPTKLPQNGTAPSEKDR